jgi:CubicO group peptidase (beta-lactamase class C family)
MKTIVPTLTLVAFSACAADWRWPTAAPEDEGLSTARLESLWNSLERNQSKTLLVVRNDKIVFERYAADYSRSTKHYTASLAKAVVGGLSVACALSDGSLALDEPAAKYVPHWKNDLTKSKITLRHLGSHTSGLEDAEEGKLAHEQLTGWKGDFWKRLPPPRDPFTLARDTTPVLFEPGTKLQYSNPGLAMLGYVVTAAERTDLRVLLHERVMQPLGVPAGEWVAGYGQSVMVEELRLVPTWGGGSYSPNAVARIGRLMLHKGNWEGKQLLKAAAVEAVTSDAGTPGNGGIGWWSNNDGSADPLPRDAFWGAGAGHQVLLVIPSLNLIASRFGGVLDSRLSYDQALRKRFFEPLMAAIGPREPNNASSTPLHYAPFLQEEVRTDGRLEEPCYRSLLALTNFVVAGRPGTKCQSTKAWLFWRDDGLYFAFEAVDAQIVAARPSPREHDVDAQDRVEVFLWSGNTNDTYYCIEVGARGAVHDYSARFYRRFDDDWKPAGLQTAVRPTAAGYCVEGVPPRAALESAGFRLKADQRIRCGLFRADFAPGKPEDPTWLCWVDARGPQPDFHVAGSFGEILLATPPDKPK